MIDLILYIYKCISACLEKQQVAPVIVPSVDSDWLVQTIDSQVEKVAALDTESRVEVGLIVILRHHYRKGFIIARKIGKRGQAIHEVGCSNPDVDVPLRGYSTNGVVDLSELRTAESRILVAAVSEGKPPIAVVILPDDKT